MIAKLPRELAGRWLDARKLEIGFVLAAGCYATTVLEDLLEVEDAAVPAGESAAGAPIEDSAARN